MHINNELNRSPTTSAPWCYSLLPGFVAGFLVARMNLHGFPSSLFALVFVIGCTVRAVFFFIGCSFRAAFSLGVFCRAVFVFRVLFSRCFFLFHRVPFPRYFFHWVSFSRWCFQPVLLSRCFSSGGLFALLFASVSLSALSSNLIYFVCCISYLVSCILCLVSCILYLVPCVLHVVSCILYVVSCLLSFYLVSCILYPGAKSWQNNKCLGLLMPWCVAAWVSCCLGFLLPGFDAA
jgi:hypothetical protein